MIAKQVSRRRAAAPALALALILWGSWAGAPRAQELTEAQLYEAAKKEGEVDWFDSHYNADTGEKIGRAFTEKYPGIKVNVFKATAAVVYQRLSQDLKAGTPQCDVYSSTDPTQFVVLKPQGAFEKYTPPNADKVIDAAKNIDPDGYYHITWAGLVTINYNKDKLKEADVPKSWTELLDPKWKEQVTTGSPIYSGTVAVWLVLMKKLYGLDYIDKLAVNKPQVGRSIDDTVTQLNSGERNVAAGDPATTLKSAARGNPLGVTYPSDGALMLIGPSAIIKNARHPAGAKLFENFLISEETGKIATSEFEQTVRPEVPPAPGGKSLKDIKVQLVPIADLVTDLTIVKDKWRDVFGN